MNENIFSKKYFSLVFSPSKYSIKQTDDAQAEREEADKDRPMKTSMTVQPITATDRPGVWWLSVMRYFKNP